LVVTDENAGKQGKCPFCKRAVTIPGDPVAMPPEPDWRPRRLKPKPFSKKEALRFGWNAMRSAIPFFVGMVIVCEGLNHGPDLIAIYIKKDRPVLSIVIGAAGLPVQMIFTLGLMKIALRFADNPKGAWRDLLVNYRLFFRYVIASFLYALLVTCGLILFIVPGIYWAIKYSFFPYLIIEKDLGPLKALDADAAVTGGARDNLLLFRILCALVNLAGLLCLGVGLFAALPTTWVADAYVYRKLLAQTDSLEIDSQYRH
jgi:hypothetical protein